MKNIKYTICVTLLFILAGTDVVLSQCNGELQFMAIEQENGELGTTAILADIDNDGDLDAVQSGSTNTIRLNDGSGNFSLSNSTWGSCQDGNCYTDFELGDLDGDGDLDVFGSGLSASPSQVWFNNGSGNFTVSAQNMVFQNDSQGNLSLGDIDNDGDIDAVNGFRENIGIWKNNGNGIFVLDVVLNFPSEYVLDVALGDLDGDTDLDLYVANIAGNVLGDRVYTNNGSGIFNDSQVSFGNSPSGEVDLIDLDDDGDLDVFLNKGGSGVIYLNDGTGILTPGQIGIPSIALRKGSIGDLDLDGDKDLLLLQQEVTNVDSEYIHLNDGSASFQLFDSNFIDLDVANSVSLGDLDGDGDLDAYVPNRQGIAVWFNQLCEGLDDDPCDLTASLIPNPDFEEITCEPQGNATPTNDALGCAIGWEQATEATADFFSLNAHDDREARGELMEMPEMLNPDSDRWVGGWRNVEAPTYDQDNYIEYVGAELLSPIIANTLYTFKLKIGAPKVTQNYLPETMEQDIVILGLPDNTVFPIAGINCKQDEYEEIGRVSVSVPNFSWIETSIEIIASQDYKFIMFGLACDITAQTDFTYFLADDLLLIQGEDPCPSSDPCNDLSASLIPNPDFEEKEVDCIVNSQQDLGCAVSWEQATQATSDLFDVVTFPDLGGQFWSHPQPSSGDRFVGMWRIPQNDLSGSLVACSTPEDYIEYVGSELISTMSQSQSYTLNLKVGNPFNDSNGGFTPDVLDSDFVVLGLPDNTNFPIAGCDCKENDYEVIGKTSISIPAGTWQEVNVEIDDQKSQDYNFIMFGLSCERPINNRRNYLLVDDLNLVSGTLDCPSDCFSITADSPPCNSDIDTENLSTYTYDFTFKNETNESFSQILLFDADESFDIDAGTLLDLGTTLAPGQSVDLSWDINANSYEAETYMYCFDIAPYNHEGTCCKAQHCVELESCCIDIPSNNKNMIDSETDCCYTYGYENCVPDYYVNVAIEMETEGLGISGTVLQDGYQLTQQSDDRIVLSMLNGNFLPDGNFDEILEFCVEGMSSGSPEMQEITLTWGYVEDNEFGQIEAELCTLECPIPPDECALLIDPVLYCDDFGVYHYRFQVQNVNAMELDASIVVLGPVEGSGTTPDDFSQATFPDFPDHTPNGDAYLEFDDLTGEIDITLPNASLGDSYEFIISLHDYRNINAELGEYWCCYTPGSFTIDVNEICDDIGAFVEDGSLRYVVYPNPLEDVFVMKFQEPVLNNTSMIISDLNGNIIKRELIKSKIYDHRVDVGDLNAGIYYVSVYGDSGKGYHQRFIKN